MNSLEKKMVKMLIDLKNNHYLLGVKAEFEAEGTRIDEALRLKDIVNKAGLDFTIKIGGCEALKDMHEAKLIGVDSIVAPMIESSYALIKYLNAIKSVFSQSEIDDMRFFINVETVTGANVLEDILRADTHNYITGVVLGRTDMAGSLDLEREDVDSDKILNIAQSFSKTIKNYNKEFIIGGGVSPHSISFFKQVPYISKFETRKLIFDANNAINNVNEEETILKAVAFELMWIKNKQNLYRTIYEEDLSRLNMFERKYKDVVKNIEDINNYTVIEE